jgi:hypothetical protein
MMAFDVDKDGKLTKSEITDQRLVGLFDRADSNHDGNVTKEELAALAAKEPAPRRGFPGGGPPGGGPGGPMMGPGFGPRPGEILPRMVQERLNLSAEQAAQVEALQKDVDAKLAKILSAEQNEQLKEMRTRGPGGRGPGPGGPGGPFGPSGPGGGRPPGPPPGESGPPR